MNTIKLFLKKYIKPIMPVVFLLTLALNIWFFCMPIFQSSAYVGDNDEWHYNIRFDNNTYSGYLEYKKNTSGMSKDFSHVVGLYFVENKTIILNGKSYRLRNGNNNNYWESSDIRIDIQKDNIFTMHIGSGDHAVKCTNAGAVVLEIFYLIALVSSGIISIEIILEYIKSKKNWKKINSSEQ